MEMTKIADSSPSRADPKHRLERLFKGSLNGVEPAVARIGNQRESTRLLIEIIPQVNL